MNSFDEDFKHVTVVSNTFVVSLDMDFKLFSIWITCKVEKLSIGL